MSIYPVYDQLAFPETIAESVSILDQISESGINVDYETFLLDIASLSDQEVRQLNTDLSNFLLAGGGSPI